MAVNNDKQFSENITQRLRNLANAFGEEPLKKDVEKLSNPDGGIAGNLQAILQRLATVAENQNIQGIWQQVHDMLREIAKIDKQTADNLNGIDLNNADERVRKASQDRLLAMLRDNELANFLAKQYATLPKSSQNLIGSLMDKWSDSVKHDAAVIIDQNAMRPEGFVFKHLVELFFLAVKICIGIVNPEGLERLERHCEGNNADKNDTKEGSEREIRYMPIPGMK